MKKLIFVGLLSLLSIGCVKGQIKPENKWIIGTWERESEYGDIINTTFNEDGTGIMGTLNFIFSVNEDLVTMFFKIPYSDGEDYHPPEEYNIYKINNQKMVLKLTKDKNSPAYHFAKVNN